MQKGDKKIVAICPDCRKVNEFNGFKTKRHEGGFLAFGIECPSCGHWKISYWLTEELLAMQTLKPKRDVRREYERKFKKLQGLMSKKIRAGTVPPELGEKNGTNSDKIHKA